MAIGWMYGCGVGALVHRSLSHRLILVSEQISQLPKIAGTPRCNDGHADQTPSKEHP